ncbi:cephalosporin hydroxylase family protein [Metapseudomonas resinovorans]|uniref:cephalosporin hydroxylase family protein n=1 Tax=Metapseudomonas resinovorans TaxID=53412 RepID=UPI000416C210|nr:cephalosporin hydroxylase family protein [Pseudomonas resinovorans]
MNATDPFDSDMQTQIEGLKADRDVQALSRIWLRETSPHRYVYNFKWMGRPIIQFPQDMMAMQEIVWATRPDLIIETGVAHGGSVLYYASLLELMGHGEVIGIDIEIRAHNRKAIEEHPMNRRLRLIEGSSIDPNVIAQVQELAKGKRAIVVLDSNHSHDHVLAELRAYAPLVCKGGYCVVMDTVVEDLPASLIAEGRPWSLGNNPKTAVHEFLKESDEFVIDRDLEAKLLITVAPDGYLKRI